MIAVQVVDPSAYTPPYDHSLCAALARAGAGVELITSSFAYGSIPQPDGYAVRELFYRRARGAPGSATRRLTKLLEHGPDMARLRRGTGQADVVHFQWLPVQWLDRHMLPRRPVVLTAHDLLPREPRPLQAWAQRRLYGVADAIVVHSEYGRRQLVQRLGVPDEKVRVIHHGAFDYLTRTPEGPLPEELRDAARSPSGSAAAGSPAGSTPPAPASSDAPAPASSDAPDTSRVVLFFGLLRPYKGLDTLLAAWGALDPSTPAELWIVGRPRMDATRLKAASPATVRWVERFVSDSELAACFRRADVVVLPYRRTERLDFSGVLATALAFGKPAVVTDVGGFGEVAVAGGARLVPPGDSSALSEALAELLSDDAARRRLAEGARRLAEGTYSWDEAAGRTISLYLEILGTSGVQ